MSDVFILQNQEHLYLDKQGQWTEGREASSLYRTPHKDEALNQKLELTVRDPELRIKMISCGLDDKGRPRITNTEAAPTTAEPEKTPTEEQVES